MVLARPVEFGRKVVGREEDLSDDWHESCIDPLGKIERLHQDQFFLPKFGHPANCPLHGFFWDRLRDVAAEVLQEFFKAIHRHGCRWSTHLEKVQYFYGMRV